MSENWEEIKDEKKEDVVPTQTSPSTLWQIFHALLSAGALDALMLTSLACCSRVLRDSVEDAWAGIRAGTPTIVLKKVECRVDEEAQNKRVFGLCRISGAGPCQVCGKLARFLHSILGTKLCAVCGKNAEANCYSEFAMISEDDAKKRYHISSTSPLSKHLRCASRLPHTYTVTDAPAATTRFSRPH
jgi:hypothetical protein